MKLTDALLGEHAVLYELFGFVRDTMAKSDDLATLQSAAAVLERLLVSHAQVEEDLLFPALEPHMGGMGPLAQMHAEHEQIVGLMESARGESDAEAIKSILSRLLNLAHDHFHKEEQVLFPMTKQFIDEETLTALGDQWATGRKVVIDGQGCGGGA